MKPLEPLTQKQMTDYVTKEIKRINDKRQKALGDLARKIMSRLDKELTDGKSSNRL